MRERTGLPLGRLVRHDVRTGIVCLLVIACTCACLMLQRHTGNVPTVLLEEPGAGGEESLAALEQQKAQLQKFITRTSGGHQPARIPSDGRDAHPISASKSEAKPCGKLCQTRRMILKARMRIDSQAHVELQQLAVSLISHHFVICFVHCHEKQ